jgi:L-alanine-DL-glutamate epimerase-like enolase superfamily enzyme
MRIATVEIVPVNARYKHPEVSALTARRGITEILVRLTTDEGLVGWGESSRTADANTIVQAMEAMQPLVTGRDPWDREAIARDLDLPGMWGFQPMTRNIAFAGIDMALWDLCGKACGQPLYRLFGGAVREEVDYFYYLHWADPDAVAAQARDGLTRGYHVFYMKVGSDRKAEEAMLEAVRATIGPDAKLRIDANMAWTVPEAVDILEDWHEKFRIDFVEAPVAIDPLECTLEVKRRVRTSICVNEGLWREHDVLRVIRSRCGDYLCFSNYWVGSLRRFHTLAHLADLEGLLVCKHTPGELGLTAAAGQHMMLATPNACDGHQQTAQMMQDDVLVEPLPIAEGPRWGRIEEPGLGVHVDEDKVRQLHEAYLRDGAFAPYGDSFHPRRR